VMVGGVGHDLASLLEPFAGKPDGLADMDAGRLPLAAAMPEHDYWWHDRHWLHSVRSSCCNPTV
jgi:hypothetical protein